MERARTVGGVILDEKGNPVENANVKVDYLDGEQNEGKSDFLDVQSEARGITGKKTGALFDFFAECQ